MGKVETTDESAALCRVDWLKARPHPDISAFGEPTALLVLASIRGTLFAGNVPFSQPGSCLGPRSREQTARKGKGKKYPSPRE